VCSSDLGNCELVALVSDSPSGHCGDKVTSLGTTLSLPWCHVPRTTCKKLTVHSCSHFVVVYQRFACDIQSVWV